MRYTIKAFKSNFFNPKAVTVAVDRARYRNLSKLGAYVRQTARQSIKSLKGISKPGSPPHSHTGLLKRFIFFAYDRQTESVVVGPARLGGRAEAPALLEYGGRARRFRKQAVYKARPFMRPALEKEKDQNVALWRDSVKSTI